MGVRAYSVTTAVWTRRILIDEFGLDSSKVTWVGDDEEHVTQLQLPSNVRGRALSRSVPQRGRTGSGMVQAHGNLPHSRNHCGEGLCANFPRFDVNPNTGEPLGLNRRSATAVNSVYHDAKYPSSVTLPIVARTTPPTTEQRPQLGR